MAGAASSLSDARREGILDRIRAIPEGFVQTYGDIEPAAPRLVGHVLASHPGDDLPWHRVVRADGSVAKGRRQLRLLEREGVPFRGERVDLRRARLPRDLMSLSQNPAGAAGERRVKRSKDAGPTE